jgi:hypothetical protein
VEYSQVDLDSREKAWPMGPPPTWPGGVFAGTCMLMSCITAAATAARSPSAYFPLLDRRLATVLAYDVLHDDVATPLACEDEVDLGDARNARRVGVHDLGHLDLCAGPKVIPVPYFIEGCLRLGSRCRFGGNRRRWFRGPAREVCRDVRCQQT